MTVKPASPAVILYGTEHPPASIDCFQLGPLSFDLEAGKIRYIRFAGIEALRCIAFVVRGPGWESPAPVISDLKSAQSEDGLSIRYRAFYETAGGQLEVRAAIDALRHGGIVFTAEAHALTDFTTARTSFCILHPIEAVAGTPLDLTRPDESVEQVHFPDHISAHQPFMNIRALSHELAGGIRATVRMEGDIWEMEDQRNWTDASFKTYGRPRDLPWPYTIGKGDRVVQRAILAFERASPVAATAASKDIVIGIGNAPIGRLPRVALALSPEEAPLAMAAAPALSALPHELIAWYEHGVQDLVALEAYAALGRRLKAPVGLELVLPCKAPFEREMADAAALLHRADLRPSSLLAIQAPMTRWVLKRPEELGLPGFAEVYAAARRCFPGVALGAGVTSNFTEFNIDRPDLEGVDYVTHSTAAVIHEPDDRSVMETLETLPHIFRSMRHIAGGLPYRLGPKRHRDALQSLWQDHRGQCRQCADRFRPAGPAPSRVVRRGIRARLFLPRRRGRDRQCLPRRADRFLRPDPSQNRIFPALVRRAVRTCRLPALPSHHGAGQGQRRADLLCQIERPEARPRTGL
jgi:hypothetical protein